jgi:gluconate 2-dehydrogenase gamma chain
MTMFDSTTGGDDPTRSVDGLSRHTRRDVFRYGASATVAVAIPGVVAACGGGSKSKHTSVALSKHKQAALTSQEMTTLKSVLAQLLPQDNLGPGAVEAGVHVYIDNALAGPYKSYLPVYRELLTLLDKAAAQVGGRSFSGLSSANQLALLAKFDAGTPPGVLAADRAAAAGGFQLLLENMREGMFADPMYGGNQSLAGWDLIGYPGVTLVWSAEDQTIGARVPRSGKTAKSYGGAPFNGPQV